MRDRLRKPHQPHFVTVAAAGLVLMINISKKPGNPSFFLIVLAGTSWVFAWAVVARQQGAQGDSVDVESERSLSIQSLLCSSSRSPPTSGQELCVTEASHGRGKAWREDSSIWLNRRGADRPGFGILLHRKISCRQDVCWAASSHAAANASVVELALEWMHVIDPLGREVGKYHCYIDDLHAMGRIIELVGG